LGQVVVTPATNRLTAGQQVTVTATSDAGQVFLGWGGDASGEENPLVVTMNQSKHVVARFSNQPRLALEIDPGMVAEGSARVILTGEAGTRQQLDYSDALPAWTPLVLLTNRYGTVEFLDTTASNTMFRFYRTVQAP
jgi:hypothetical protein